MRIILFLILATPAFSLSITDTERFVLMFMFGKNFADRVESSLSIGNIGSNVAAAGNGKITISESAIEEFNDDCVLFHEAYHLWATYKNNRSTVSGRRSITIYEVTSGRRLTSEQEANVAQVIGLWNVSPPQDYVREIEFEVNYDTYMLCLAYAKKYMKIDSRFLF